MKENRRRLKLKERFSIFCIFHVVTHHKVATDPEKPGKALFFFQKVFENLEKSGKVFKNLAHHGIVMEFSSEIPFNPFSILSLSIETQGSELSLPWCMEAHSYISYFL